MEATYITALEGMDLEPVIDLTKSTTPQSLLLNVEAELQIMRNRERNAQRRNQTFVDVADERVRAGWNYTPGVGWDTGIAGRYDGPVPQPEPEPVLQLPAAPTEFVDVRTGELTVIETDGTVSVGNALEELRHLPHWTSSRSTPR